MEVDWIKKIKNLRLNKYSTTAKVNMFGGAFEILYLLYRIDPSIVRAKNSMGQTPLFYAAKMGNVEAVVFLLRIGCKASDEDSNGQTPLHYASLVDPSNAFKVDMTLWKKEAAKDLDANLDVSLPFNKNVSHVVNRRAVMRLLIEAGADPAAGDARSRQPIYYCQSDLSMKAVLVDAGNFNYHRAALDKGEFVLDTTLVQLRYDPKRFFPSDTGKADGAHPKHLHDHEYCLNPQGTTRSGKLENYPGAVEAASHKDFENRTFRYGESAKLHLLRECPTLGVLYVSHYSPDIWERRNATGQYVVWYPIFTDADRLAELETEFIADHESIVQRMHNTGGDVPNACVCKSVGLNESAEMRLKTIKGVAGSR